MHRYFAVPKVDIPHPQDANVVTLKAGERYGADKMCVLVGRWPDFWIIWDGEQCYRLSEDNEMANDIEFIENEDWVEPVYEEDAEFRVVRCDPPETLGE